MSLDKNKAIETAKHFDGYLEKASASYLDDFTRNVGSNNFTKFGRDYDAIMGTHLNGQPWCAMFVSMIFVWAYGLNYAKMLLGGNLFAYTPAGALQMKAKAGVKPKAGDVVFFHSNSLNRISHVGLVTKVDGSKFYTIEGNTSSAAGVVRNGGAVRQKSYPLGYSTARFATPPYDTIAVAPEKPKKITFKPGNKYILTKELSVFKKPRTSAGEKVYNELTQVQKDKDQNRNGKLDKDSIVVCKSVKENSNGNIWLEIGGSGWILAYRKSLNLYNVKEG